MLLNKSFALSEINEYPLYMKIINILIILSLLICDLSLAAQEKKQTSRMQTHKKSRSIASKQIKKTPAKVVEDEEDDTPIEPSQAQMQNCADAAKKRFDDLVINEAPRFSQVQFDFEKAITAKINMPDMANDRVGKRRRKVKLHPKPYEPGLRISLNGTGLEANGTRALKAHCIVGRRALVTVTYEFFELKSNGQQNPTPNNTPAEN